MGFGDDVALALGQLAETGGQSLLDPVQVARPVRQPLLDARVRELTRRLENAVVQAKSSPQGAF